MRKFIFITVFCLSSSLTASAQNLDKLMTTAQRYLQARGSGSKRQISEFAVPEQRNEFLERNPPLITKAHIDKLEFTNDPKVVYVVYTGTFAIQEAGGLVSIQNKEQFVWKGNDWFLKLPKIPDSVAEGLFRINKDAPPSPDSATNQLPFELSVNKIDLGKHPQGEVVRRTISFKSDKDRFAGFRNNEFKGLFISGPTWTSDGTGQFEIALDTTLLTEDVRSPLELEIAGWQGQRVKASFEVTAQIEPRLRFSQTPQIIDPATAGTAEIQIENVSNTSFKPTSLQITNPAYEISDYTRGMIDPGKTLKIVVRYQPQPTPSGAVLNVQTSPSALADPNFVLPLNVKLPVSRGAGYTKEELEEILRRMK
jgi:hypothetical protein